MCWNGLDKTMWSFAKPTSPDMFANFIQLLCDPIYTHTNTHLFWLLPFLKQVNTFHHTSKLQFISLRKDGKRFNRDSSGQKQASDERFHPEMKASLPLPMMCQKNILLSVLVKPTGDLLFTSSVSRSFITLGWRRVVWIKLPSHAVKITSLVSPLY